MLIVFTGHRTDIGVATLDFFNIVGDMPVNKMFQADPKRHWYHDGIRGVGSEIKEDSEALRALCEKQHFKSIVTIGNSAGAYTAILFGVLIGAKNVLAFSPHTRIKKMNDAHNPALLEQMLLSNPRSSGFFRDLRHVIQQCNIDTKINIIYPKYNRLDHRHASYINDLAPVKSIGLPTMFHNLIKVLKEMGRLKQLIESAVTGEYVRIDLFNSEKSYLFTLSTIYYGKNLIRKAVKTKQLAV